MNTKNLWDPFPDRQASRSGNRLRQLGRTLRQAGRNIERFLRWWVDHPLGCGVFVERMLKDRDEARARAKAQSRQADPPAR